MLKPMIRRALPALLATTTLGTPVLAGDPLDSVLSHRVLPGWTTEQGTRVAALELTLAPGWKTYWRSPGDAGIPPSFSWRGARNLSNVQVHWPTPGVFWQAGMRSIGYEERVVLPLTLSPKSSNGDIRLKGRMELGICSDICVPATLDIDSLLPASASSRNPAIVAALAAVPYTAREAGVRSASCRLSPSEDGLTVQARVQMPSAGGSEQAVIEAPTPEIWVSEPETSRSGDTLTISAQMMSYEDAPLLIDRSGIRITVIGGRHAVDIQGCSG